MMKEVPWYIMLGSSVNNVAHRFGWKAISVFTEWQEEIGRSGVCRWWTIKTIYGRLNPRYRRS